MPHRIVSRATDIALRAWQSQVAVRAKGEASVSAQLDDEVSHQQLQVVPPVVVSGQLTVAALGCSSRLVEEGVVNAFALGKGSGRAAFGGDPAGYDRSRPDYPEWIFDSLRARCDVREGTAVFEIGAGTGKATRPLLGLGADPLIAIEPDARLANFLVGNVRSASLRVINRAFEDVDFGERAFDMGTSATAFHWLDEDSALIKIAKSLRVGGWWAPFWNTYGDANRSDPFHEATETLLSAGPTNPSHSGSSRFGFGADIAARTAAMRATGAFGIIECEQTMWTVTLDATQIVGLYSSFSNVALHPEREAVLAELGRIAREDFGNQVTRNVTTTLYLAQRKPLD